jgi:NTP pyrophosphatase (non-canonical NTP hydrolase)
MYQMDKLNQIFKEIAHERARQDAKFGEQNHTAERWLTILGEEVGEVNRAVIDHWHGGKNLDAYSAELVQVAAVAIAMLQAHERSENAQGLTAARLYEIGKLFYFVENKVLLACPDLVFGFQSVAFGINFYLNDTFLRTFGNDASYSCILWLRGAMDSDDVIRYLEGNI